MVREQVARLAASGWRIHLCAERLDVAWAAALPITWSMMPAPWWRRAQIRERFDRWASSQVRLHRPGLVVGHGDLSQQDVLHLHNLVHRAHEALHQRPLPTDDALGRHHAWQLTRPGLHVVANSQLMADELAGPLWQLRRDQVRVIHPGYDPARFAPQSAAARSVHRQHLHLPADRLIVGLVASGDLHKRGADLFLRALALIPPVWSARLHAVIVGKPRDLQPYRALLPPAVPLAIPVTLLAPRAAIGEVYHSLDLLVVPARFEEFGMCVLEAAACRVPLVVSATTGAAPLVTAGGTILTDLEPQTIAAAIVQRLETMTPPHGDLSDLAWEAHVAQVAACYSGLLRRIEPPSR